MVLRKIIHGQQTCVNFFTNWILLKFSRFLKLYKSYTEIKRNRTKPCKCCIGSKLASFKYIKRMILRAKYFLPCRSGALDMEQAAPKSGTWKRHQSKSWQAYMPLICIEPSGRSEREGAEWERDGDRARTVRGPMQRSTHTDSLRAPQEVPSALFCFWSTPYGIHFLLLPPSGPRLLSAPWTLTNTPTPTHTSTDNF